MNDADISKLKAEVSQTAPDTQILYACPSGVYHRVLAVGMPSAPDDGVPEPCECALFPNGLYACLDGLELSDFIRTTALR